MTRKSVMAMTPAATRKTCQLPVVWCAAILYIMLAIPRVALAGDGPERDDCGANATPEDKQKARAFIEKGFTFHRNLQLEEAAQAYEQALEHWAHPETHFALARVLLFSVRLPEAYKHMSAVMRCPEALASDAERQEAADMLRRLDAQLAHIEIKSPDDQTEILLNGSLWFKGSVGPSQEKVVFPGQFVVAARRPGHRTANEPLTLAAGDRVSITPTSGVRRLTPWIPFAVLGTGLVLGGVGIGVYSSGAANASELQRLVDKCRNERCGGEGDNFVALERAIVWKDQVGVSAMVLGGAAVLTGIVLTAWNWKSSFQMTTVRKDTVSLIPVISRDATGVMGTMSF